MSGPGGLKLFTFVDNGWVEGTTYDLIGFGSTTLGLEQFGFTNGVGFLGGTFQYDGQKLQFAYAAVPESSTLALLALTLAGGLVFAVQRSASGRD